MSWTVIEADGNGVRETRRGGTLTGEARETRSGDTFQPLLERLAQTGELEAKPMAGAPVTRPAETESTVECFGKDSKEAEPEPKPKLITWRLCVRIEPGELDEQTLFFRWYPSGDIPEDWYPVESYTQPIETVQQLPEGQEP